MMRRLPLLLVGLILGCAGVMHAAGPPPPCLKVPPRSTTTTADTSRAWRQLLWPTAARLWGAHVACALCAIYSPSRGASARPRVDLVSTGTRYDPVVTLLQVDSASRTTQAPTGAREADLRAVWGAMVAADAAPQVPSVVFSRSRAPAIANTLTTPSRTAPLRA